MMGYAMRTDKYRYVEWYDWNKDDTRGNLLSKELFDHDTDPQENLNLANQARYQAIVDSLSQQLAAGWRKAVPKN